MNWRRLLLIPIVLAGAASIVASGPEDNPFKDLQTVSPVTCAAGSIAVTVAITTKQSGTDWVTTATGSVTCTSTTPATPLANVQVGVMWPWKEMGVATTDAKGNYSITSAKKAGQPSGAAVAGVQPATPAGGTAPAPATATSNKL
ncbi:MAG: hypothetical protein ABSD44_10720 [Terracidiphilus sp.]